MADKNFEAQLFKAADKLRKNIDAAEYKNVALGLIFLKYISESFQELYDKLAQDEFSDPEDRDEYKAENIFFVPEQARWKNLQAKAKLPTIGQELDDAMESIEKENPELRNVLPKVFGKPNLDKTSLGQLIDLISNTELKATSENSKDLFGRVYEYFLGEFANAEGKKGGQFYTPKSIVKLMVEMIEPYKGRVYDPACGSGGMFVMSEKFVQEHQGNIKDITIYGQESNQTTWKLSKMNLAIRNINSQFVAWNTEGSFLKDAHPDLKADYILANPPFNQSDWGQEILQDDARWKYGVPPSGNANFAWLQHMLYHLAPHGVMATVLANGSLASQTSGEGEIRKNLIQNDLVECIVALPDKLFYNTGISACIWFLRKEKQKRKGEILFIDASKIGYMKDNTHRELSEEDVRNISKIYQNWYQENEIFENIDNFCKSIPVNEIIDSDYNLTPGRYIEVFEDKSKRFSFEDNIYTYNKFFRIFSDELKSINTNIINVLKKYFSNHNWDNISFDSNEMIEKFLDDIFYELFGQFSNNSELPNGYDVGKLKDFVKFLQGTQIPVNNQISYKKDGFERFIRIVDYTSNFKEEPRYVERNEKNSYCNENEIIMVRYGDVGFVGRRLAGVFANNLFKITPIKKINNEFLYYFLRSKKIQQYIKNNGAGSALPAIKHSTIGDIDFIVPSDEKLKMFSEISEAFEKKILLNMKEKDCMDDLFNNLGE